MNKSDLIAQLAERMNIPRRKATSIVNTILKAMTNTLALGKNIEIRTFGSFTIKDYGAYEGTNPRSGEIIKVKAKKLPVFKISRELREKVNEGK